MSSEREKWGQGRHPHVVKASCLKGAPVIECKKNGFVDICDA